MKSEARILNSDPPIENRKVLGPVDSSSSLVYADLKDNFGVICTCAENLSAMCPHAQIQY